jgi:hypothetical protein
MASIHRDQFAPARDQARMGLDLGVYQDAGPAMVLGEVFIKMWDPVTGEILHEQHVKNVITLDASILAAILFKNSASRLGATMLGIGTGATGALLSPNAPNPAQRKLNAEIARKAWSSTVYRDAGGAAVAIPTNVIDYNVTYDEGEAVGPLNEMGILSTISQNPLTLNPNPDVYPARDVTRNLTLYDILMNYLTFGVITKPSTARLSITWRITH